MERITTISSAILPKEYVVSQTLEMLKKGLPHGLETGVPALDNLFRLDTRRLCVITGVPNDGKSEFVDFLTTSYNKKYGYKTLFFSPENQPYPFQVAKLFSKYTYKPFNKSSVSDEEALTAINYIADNFYFFNYDLVSTPSQILEAAEERINETGVKILVIDAFNKIEGESAGEDSLVFISRLLDTLCRFAIKKDILIILVAHPRKMETTGGARRQPSPYDINGSADFFNKSDFVLSVQRDRETRGSNKVFIQVGKVKFKNYGKQGSVELYYDEVSGNYYSKDDYATAEWDDSASYSDSPNVPFTFPTLSVKEPLDVDVSVYNGVADTKGSVKNLRDFLFTDEYRDVAEDIRSYPTPKERKARKDEVKSSLPCATVGGTFDGRANRNLLAPSGLICIDIDYKDNTENINEIPSIVKGLDYVSYFSKSITGDGYFAIIKIANPHRFLNHYYALYQEFSSMGITIDKSCKDIARLRFATYDESPYYNPCACTYYSECEIRQVNNSTPVKRESSYPETPTEERVRKHIAFLRKHGLYLPDDYNTWFRVGLALCSEFGEAGRELFHEISALSPSKYNAADCDEQYDKILNHEEYSQCTIATLFYLFKETENPYINNL